jgi:hypothetical protein
MANFLKSLPPSAVYILGGFLLILLIFSIRGSFRKKDKSEDKTQLSFSDLVDSPNLHRIMLWLALSFAMGLIGFVAAGIIRQLVG